LIDGFTSSDNDRFANDPGFIGSSFDFSGVARTDNDHWVTMITPNIFLSSNHFKSGPGTNVTFFEGNDPSGPSLNRQIGSSSQRIASSDIWIGTLDQPLTNAYATYSIASLTSPTQVFLVGQSPTTYTDTSLNMAVGQNVVNRILTNITASGTTDNAYGADDDSPGETNYVVDESLVQGGDSGSPLFVGNGSGGLSIAGTGWVRYELQDNQNNIVGEGSGYTILSNYTTEIQTFVDANTLAAIPEPRLATLLLSTVALTLYLRHSHGKRRRTAT
jgi:hypothetical protein